MNNSISITTENQIVTTVWCQLCNSLLHNWHFGINREVGWQWATL
jgi:hypothetical protein